MHDLICLQNKSPRDVIKSVKKTPARGRVLAESGVNVQLGFRPFFLGRLFASRQGGAASASSSGALLGEGEEAWC